MPTDQLNESSLRRKANRHGYIIHKSRQRRHVPNLNNHGDYMLVNFNNWVAIGGSFDATLEDIDAFLKAEES